MCVCTNSENELLEPAARIKFYRDSLTQSLCIFKWTTQPHTQRDYNTSTAPHHSRSEVAVALVGSTMISVANVQELFPPSVIRTALTATILSANLGRNASASDPHIWITIPPKGTPSSCGPSRCTSRVVVVRPVAGTVCDCKSPTSRTTPMTELLGPGMRCALPTAV